jgi:lysophospholipase L1-like esterase
MRTTWFYKLMLSPVLLFQGRRMRRTALRLPEAAGQCTGVVMNEGSQSELKLLFVGDSTMAGVGVQHQTAALAFQVASILASNLDRSVRWQLAAKSGINTSQAFELIKGQPLMPADVIVTALGVNDVTSQITPVQFVTAYEVLICGLKQRVGAQFAVISGLPPLHIAPAAPQPLRWYLGRCAHLLDERLCRWIASQRNIAYISLQWASDPNEMAADGFHPGENLYRKWAGLIAEEIAQWFQTRGGTGMVPPSHRLFRQE